MIDLDKNEFHLGVVKWFGGYNKQKERENDFGFIESSLGEDIFIHKSEINNFDSLDSDELVFFEIGIKKGKKFARNLYRPGEDYKISPYVISIFSKSSENICNLSSSHSLKKLLINLVDENLKNNNVLFLDFLRSEAKNNFSIYYLVHESINWYQLFELINGSTSLESLLDSGFPPHLIPLEFFESQEKSYYCYIKKLRNELKNKFFEENIEKLSIYLIFASILENELVDEKFIKYRFNEISELIESRFREENRLFPEYLEVIYKNNKNDYKSNPTLQKILEPIFLKRGLYNKNIDVRPYFEQSTYLKKDTECFILTQFFSLILAGNSLDVTYQIFSHNLWEALVEETIGINDKGVLDLFPSCSTLGHSGLSCEAVYWPKIEKYLCRGRVCKNPQVKSDNLRHYLDFTIYDWFSHYGIDYTNDGEPSKKDFPIKLAGYFNRLKEIFNVLHCYQCNKLMRPNMKYARVEYTDYESGVPITKSMSAAYRATVFKCGNEQCLEYESSYYISHCLGFGCGSIIDARDLKQKCDTGLYICRGCGSCCEQHAKKNPIGSCPDCGNSLDLFENKDMKDKFGRFERFVSCNNQQCSFEIRKNLPKKFTLPSCQPVININYNGIRF